MKRKVRRKRRSVKRVGAGELIRIVANGPGTRKQRLSLLTKRKREKRKCQYHHKNKNIHQLCEFNK